MTEAEVLAVINKICDRYAYKFQFGYFEPDDIRQEAFIIAVDALNRYEEGRPLENFLAVHVKNRLNNFKRDKYYRQNKKKQDDKQEKLNNSKKFLMEPLDISNIQDENESRMREEIDLIEKISEEESGHFLCPGAMSAEGDVFSPLPSPGTTMLVHGLGLG